MNFKLYLILINSHLSFSVGSDYWIGYGIKYFGKIASNAREDIKEYVLLSLMCGIQYLKQGRAQQMRVFF